MIIPPFAGVSLVEFRDRIQLTPYYWVREFVGYGRYRADEVGLPPEHNLHSFFNAIMGKNEIWVVVSWQRFDDGREEPLNLIYLDPEATEEDAKDRLESLARFMNKSKEELLELARLFKEPDQHLAYIEERFPDVKMGRPESGTIDERDLYQARLKVMAGLQPKTVELIVRADSTDDPKKRELIEREAVQAFFAEMAHLWTEDMVLRWQKANPIGTEWIQEFARVFQEPAKEIDPVNHALVLNWLRRGLNLLSAEELSDTILGLTGQRLSPGTLKKRRERLGLTTERRPGPPPRAEQ